MYSLNWRVLSLVIIAGLVIFSTGKEIHAEPIGLTGIADDIETIITYIGIETDFNGYAIHRDGEDLIYSWDFDGDDIIDWESSVSGKARHTYQKTGSFQAFFHARDRFGNNLPVTMIRVIVEPGTGIPEYTKKVFAVPAATRSFRPGDGLHKRYALILKGSNEPRFANDVHDIYGMLLKYRLNHDDIYLLDHDGPPENGQQNTPYIIDYPATKDALRISINELSSRMDADDLLFIWVTNHGNGYHGKDPALGSNYATYGFAASPYSVDPGDEKDYLESDFKLRSLFTGGRYRKNHGLNQWATYYSYGYMNGKLYHSFYRVKYVSHFENLYIASLNKELSDNDVRIEKLIDYLKGDLNRDGIIDQEAGEVIDWDNDGNPPYNDDTGEYDQDDWGEIDDYENNYNRIESMVPGRNCPYVLFDKNLDDRLDADFCHLDVISKELIADATDIDNLGLFDGVDVNGDGDLDDWVSIDETMLLYGGSITDDEFKDLLSPITSSTALFLLPCFSGGFIDDLSRPNRVILTAAEEETVSYGNGFITYLVEAFNMEYPTSTDINKDGKVSALEGFNFMAPIYSSTNNPQYDDNGDGISTAYPVQGINDEGLFGSTIFIAPHESIAVDHFELSVVGFSQIKDRPFDLTITAKDIHNNIQTQFNGTVKIEGLIEEKKPTLVISEYAENPLGFVEIQNVSGLDLNTSGWVVALNDANTGDINSVNPAFWYLPETVSAGSIMYKTSSQDDNYWGADIFPVDSLGKGWVVIIDNNGNIVDFVVWGYSADEINKMDTTVNNVRFTTGNEWKGDGSAYNGRYNGSLQRLGETDRNNSDDCYWYLSTKGKQNQFIKPLFRIPDPVPISLSPNQAGPFVDGVWQVQLSIHQKSDRVYLEVYDNLNSRGKSNLFNVGDMSTGVIQVPELFESIQSAIDFASAGDTILVSDGVYRENLIIDKSLILLSKNGYLNTEIKPSDGAGYGITINADDVVIAGFTISGFIDSSKAAVYLDQTERVLISENRFGLDSNNTNARGIYLTNSQQTTIANNIFIGEAAQTYAIHLLSSNNNRIDHNTFTGHSKGLLLIDGNQNIIEGNTFTNNSLDLHLLISNENSIFLNNFYRQYSFGIIALGTINRWYSSERSTYQYNGAVHAGYLGNYHSLHHNTDSNGNGITDSAFNIGNGETDEYPLAESTAHIEIQ